MKSGNRHFFALPRYIWSARKLDIPPGEKNFLVTDEFTLPEDVQLLAIYPHAHYVGKDLPAFQKFSGRMQKSLIYIPAWDLNWQAVFRYVAPVELPCGRRQSWRDWRSTKNFARGHGTAQRR
jgi:hypothetical protein